MNGRRNESGVWSTAELVTLFDAHNMDLSTDQPLGPEAAARSRQVDELLQVLADDDPEAAWLILKVLVEQVQHDGTDDDALGYLGAGLLEDFVRGHGSKFVDEMATAAAASERWRYALRNVRGWHDPAKIDEGVAGRLRPLVGLPLE